MIKEIANIALVLWLLAQTFFVTDPVKLQAIKRRCLDLT